MARFATKADNAVKCTIYASVWNALGSPRVSILRPEASFLLQQLRWCPDVSDLGCVLGVS